MNGTEWTEPGQGATVGMLCKALALYESERSEPEWNRAYGRLPAGSCDATKNLRRTNLRLTGHPLTAEDLKRIEQCEVAR